MNKNLKNPVHSPKFNQLEFQGPTGPSILVPAYIRSRFVFLSGMFSVHNFFRIKFSHRENMTYASTNRINKCSEQ